MNPISSASNSIEDLQLSWLKTPRSNSKKISFTDIKQYPGLGFIKIYFFVDKREIKDIRRLLKKYKRHVQLVPIENFPVFDSKGRIQLKDKSHFLQETMGLGSFYKTLSEKGLLWDMKNSGVKYLYVQPLNNVKAKILDFDLLDILISLNQDQSIKRKSILFSKESNYQPRGSLNVYGRDRQAKSKIVRKYTKPENSLFDSMNDSFDFRLSLFDQRESISNKKNLGFNSEKLQNDFQPEAPEPKVDCISKVYDVEGELSLKVHDHPSDCLNSIKFLDSEKGLNWNRLHCGESIFWLDSLTKKKVWKQFNLGKF